MEQIAKSEALSGDIWGGLAAMLVVLPSSVAFGMLVYTAMGPEYAGRGAMAGLLGAAALGIVAPLIGRTAALISAPCAPAAAVLSALVAELIASRSGGALDPAAVLSIVALTGLLSAVLQFFYGAVGGGRLIKFIPFQVVTGYLTGVGLIIALGQLPKLFGLPKGTPLIHGLMTPDLWKWQSLVVGLVTISMMVLAPRWTKKVPAAIFGLFGGVFAYFALAQFSPGLLQLQGNALVIGTIQAEGSFLHSVLSAVTGQVSSLLAIHFATLKLILVPALTLSVLLSIDTLKTCVGLDALTRSRHHSDRELMGQGVGNLASFFVGGMPGAGAMGPTLINLTSGGRSPRSGVLAGVFVLLAMLLLGRWIAWVPIGALAGILLVVAWRMLDKNIFSLLAHRSGRLDFAVIAGVITVALTVDLIAASGVGIAMAILLFIRDQVRGSVIRRKLQLSEISSKTRRRETDREILKRCGNQGVFCELQGNLFFGTTDQLYTQLEADLRIIRFLLLDMRRVQSIDYTAIHLFELMQHQLAERGGQLLFSGMPSHDRGQRDFEHYLMNMGLVGIKICETMDSALEWIEDQILVLSGAPQGQEERLLELKDFTLFRQFDDGILGHLASCMKELSLKEQGQRVFSHGVSGDEMFLVRRGSVRILLPLGGGKHHHLATVGQGEFFGELAFLDHGIRSADVEVRGPTDLYVFSRSQFDERSRADGGMGAQVFARLALEIAKRLRTADAELQATEDR